MPVSVNSGYVLVASPSEESGRPETLLIYGRHMIYLEMKN